MKRAKCLEWLPDALRPLAESLCHLSHPSEVVREADKRLRKQLGLPDDVYPKETDLVMRFWRCCRDLEVEGDEPAAAGF